MKTYIIDFGGNILAKITIEEDIPTVNNCMNGYGSPVPIENITITEVQE